MAEKHATGKEESTATGKEEPRGGSEEPGRYSEECFPVLRSTVEAKKKPPRPDMIGWDAEVAFK